MLERERSILVVIDMQEAFRPAIAEFDATASSVATLVQGANVLDLPIVVTEQYPQGLGRTVDEISAHLNGGMPCEKVSFAATGSDGFDLVGRDQVILCGVEAHVCVWQTASALLGQGVEVHAAEDAIASRTALNREIGLRRIANAGGIPTSVETALFELLGRAGSAEFKAIQPLVK